MNLKLYSVDEKISALKSQYQNKNLHIDIDIILNAVKNGMWIVYTKDKDYKCDYNPFDIMSNAKIIKIDPINKTCSINRNIIDWCILIKNFAHKVL